MKLRVAKFWAFGLVEVVDMVMLILKVSLLWQNLSGFVELVTRDEDSAFTPLQAFYLVFGLLGTHLWWGLGKVV